VTSRSINMADDGTDITPRVNFANLPMYKSRTIRLVGRVLEQEDDSENEKKVMVLESSDGQRINVLRDRGTPRVESDFVEIIGSVDDSLCVIEVLCVHFGKAVPFDLKLYDEFVKLSGLPEFRHLFE